MLSQLSTSNKAATDIRGKKGMEYNISRVLQIHCRLLNKVNAVKSG